MGLDAHEWEEEQVRLDRDWYMGAEEGGALDEEFNPLAQYEDLNAVREAEAAKKQVKRISAKQAQYNADNDLWEANRMLTSGVATRRTIDLDFEDESESSVHVMVHDLKPPFLDGRTVFTRQLEPINPVRDPTSDMAIFSRKGSALVKEKREQAERAKAAAKLAALGGTALGNIMGVQDEEAQAEGEYTSRATSLHIGVDIHVVSLVMGLQLRRRRRRRPARRRTTRATQNSPLISRQERVSAPLRSRARSRSSGSTSLPLLAVKSS